MRAAIGVVTALAVLMAGVALTGEPGVARAETVSISVALAGANEVPPVASGGAGQAQLTLDTETNELFFLVSVRGITQDQVTAAHIHRGAVGENGPVAYTLAETGFVQVSGTVELSDEDVEALFAGGLYINVHSVENPDGFARGQIVAPEGTAPDEDDDEAEATTTPGAGPTAVPGQPGPVTPPSTGDAGHAGGKQGGLLLPAALLTAFAAASALALSRRSA